MAKWHPVDRLVQRRASAKTQSLFVKQGRVVSLGREPAQNSRDNHDPDKSGAPVRMRYTWGVCKEAEYVNKHILTNTWLSHATLPDNEKVIRISDFKKTIKSSGMPYVLIEDYNTTGLTGSIEQMWELRDNDDSMIEDSKDTLYWFLRVVDESAPKPGRGGSHGMGKMAFPAASQISTMFVVSSRNDEHCPRFMCGQSFLENYFRSVGTMRRPFGPEFYFGSDVLLGKDTHPLSKKWFREEFQTYASNWIPETEREQIDRFCSTFGIDRAEDERGTSIMIPFPWADRKDSITPERMEICVLTNYALPIARGLIEFEFIDNRNDEMDPEIRVLDSTNLRSRIRELPWDAYQRGAQNAGWSTQNRMLDEIDLIDALSEPDENIVKFPIGDITNSVPDWQQDGLLPEHDDEALDTIRSTLQSGGVIHIECRDVPIKKKGGVREFGTFRLVLKNATDHEDAEAHFYRGHISLPQNLKRRAGHPGVSSLLVLEDGDPLAEMMRISEGAAHMFWDPMAAQLREDKSGKYYNARETIAFLNGSTEAVMARLSKTSTEAEPFLNEFFGSLSRITNQDGPDTPDPPEPTEGNIDVSPRKGAAEHGFVIKSAPDAEDLTGEVYIIRLGYNKAHHEPHVPRKTPDARIIDISGSYSAKDGALVDSVESQEGEVCPDRFLVRVNAPEFRVIVSGLDLGRQARVVVSPFRGGE